MSLDFTAIGSPPQAPAAAASPGRASAARAEGSAASFADLVGQQLDGADVTDGEAAVQGTVPESASDVVPTPPVVEEGSDAQAAWPGAAFWLAFQLSEPPAASAAATEVEGEAAEPPLDLPADGTNATGAQIIGAGKKDSAHAAAGLIDPASRGQGSPGPALEAADEATADVTTRESAESRAATPLRSTAERGASQADVPVDAAGEVAETSGIAVDRATRSDADRRGSSDVATGTDHLEGLAGERAAPQRTGQAAARAESLPPGGTAAPGGTTPGTSAGVPALPQHSGQEAMQPPVEEPGEGADGAAPAESTPGRRLAVGAPDAGTTRRTESAATETPDDVPAAFRFDAVMSPARPESSTPPPQAPPPAAVPHGNADAAAPQGVGLGLASGLAGTASITMPDTPKVQFESLLAAAGVETGALDAPDVPSQVVKAIALQWRQGVGEARIQLRPEHLGELSLSLRVEQGAVVATVRAESPAALEMIRARQADLQAALESHGLHLDDLVVTLDPDDRRDRPAYRPPEPPRGRRRADGPRFEVLA